MIRVIFSYYVKGVLWSVVSILTVSLINLVSEKETRNLSLKEIALFSLGSWLTFLTIVIVFILSFVNEIIKMIESR